MRRQYYEEAGEIVDDGAPLDIDRPLPATEKEMIGDWQPTRFSRALISALDTAAHAYVLAPDTESPIETALGAAIMTVFHERANDLTLTKMDDLSAAAPGTLVLVPQFAWKYYRSDWAILRAGSPRGALLIECDGKHFHTAEADVTHDTTKDQSAHDMGHLTIRFTGRQIWLDATKCARKVFDAVCG